MAETKIFIVVLVDFPYFQSHTMNISCSNVTFSREHRSERTTFPAMLNSLSTGADEAGILR